MSQKNIKILLIILVGAIWLLIGYKVFKSLQSNNPTVSTAKNTHAFATEKDTFSLKINYENPFLLKTKKKNATRRYNPHQSTSRASISTPQKNVASQSSGSRRVRGQSNASKVTSSNIPSSPQDIWPELTYKGVVFGNNKKSKGEFIIASNDKSTIVSINDTINGVVLIYGDTDSIIVKNIYDKKHTYYIEDKSMHKRPISKSNR